MQVIRTREAFEYRLLPGEELCFHFVGIALCDAARFCKPHGPGAGRGVGLDRAQMPCADVATGVPGAAQNPGNTDFIGANRPIVGAKVPYRFGWRPVLMLPRVGEQEGRAE